PDRLAVESAVGRPLRDEVTRSQGAAPAPGSGQVKLTNNRLSRGGGDWAPKMIYAPGADPALLRKTGCDVLALDLANLPVAEAAVQAGFLLMPMVDVRSAGEEDAGEILGRMASYPSKDAVAFWSLGEGLGAAPDPDLREQERVRVRALLKGLRAQPNGFPKLA